MPTVWIPVSQRDLTGNQETVKVPGKNLRQVLEELDRCFPGIRDRLCDEKGLRSGIAVAVDGHISSRGFLQAVEENSEVHFLPAISGG